MPTEAPVLEVEELTRAFGSVLAVDRLSFRLERNEYVCLLGPSGCGKTTLLRLIAGFERPDAGAIRLHGENVIARPPERRDVNVVFQSYALFPHLTVAENVGFGLRMKRLDGREVQKRVADALELVRLEREARRLPRQLSGGQQQRVALARALVNRPALLLLDEPLSALDQSLRQQMQEELRRVQRETGVAFLHITHDQQEALSMSDRLAVMRSGRFEQIGPPREIYERPSSAFVASFVGGANLLEGRLAGPDQVDLDAGSRVRIPHLSGPVEPGERVVLAIRPEALRFSEPTSDLVLQGRITGVAFRGSDVECTVEVGDSTSGSGGGWLRVVGPVRKSGPLPKEGERVGLQAEVDDWVVLPSPERVLPPSGRDSAL